MFAFLSVQVGSGASLDTENDDVSIQLYSMCGVVSCPDPVFDEERIIGSGHKINVYEICGRHL